MFRRNAGLKLAVNVLNIGFNFYPPIWLIFSMLQQVLFFDSFFILLFRNLCDCKGTTFF